MSRSWHIKLGGKPLYLGPGTAGGLDVALSGDESEPGKIGQIGTIVIPSLHHGLGPQHVRDPMTIWSWGDMDLSVPGTILRSGASNNLFSNITDENWYDDQGGGMAVYPHLGDPTDLRIMAVTARRIYRIDPATPAVTEVYVLDSSKYAFTGSCAVFRDSIYFGVESNVDQTARGRYGGPMVRYKITDNTFSVTTYKGSIVQAAKGAIWWIENRGLSDSPRVYWTDHQNFPADPSPGSLTKEIGAGADDGYIQSSGGLTVYDTQVNLRVGQTPGVVKYRSYLRFDTSSIPDNATVTSVTLRVYLVSDQSVQDFTMNVRKFAWGPTLDTGDWRANPTSDPLLGSKASSAFAAGWNEIVLDPAQAVNITGYSEFYLTSDREEQGLTPTSNEYADWEAYESTYSNEAELVVNYTTPTAVVVAGPYPIEPGGYCTAGGGVLGPWVVWFKRDGQIYGMDKDGTLAPIVPQGMTSADLRFARGNCVFNQFIIIPHSHGCLALDMSTLQVSDIHPSKVAGAILGNVPPRATAALWFGPRLFLLLGGGSAIPLLFARDVYPDGDYYTMLGQVSGLQGHVSLGIVGLLTTSGAVQLYVLNKGTGSQARIDRVDQPGVGWSVPPAAVRTGNVATPFHSGDLPLVTKRFFRVRAWAADVTGSQYYAIGFVVDGGGSYTGLGNIQSVGPFSLPFPAASSSLGRAISLQFSSFGTTATAARLEGPFFVDFEYVPATADRVRLGVAAGPQQITARGDAAIRDSAQDILDYIEGLRGTVTTLDWSNGTSWTVLVEKVSSVNTEEGTVLAGPSTAINVWVRRL